MPYPGSRAPHRQARRRNTGEPYPTPQPLDPTYPLTSILTLLQGTIEDATEPGMLDYFVKAGIFTSPGKLTQPFQELTEPDSYGTSDGQSQVPAGAQKL
ncbi:MAG: hypothetical protein JWN03_2201 [Nocardia sp.]|uniref:hypothetical protein n=1 Tax=Nocardia sp. TaxID=1821 RepID=UPI002612ADED|nr:hypothetical protein [Nocardia sp.]MCU1641926.1 hypothetical protein [Nocardia sp.]